MSDIEVTSRLRLDRQQFVGELRSSVADFKDTAREISAEKIDIEVIGKDLITKQVEEIIADLSTREIVIPVRYQVAGDPTLMTAPPVAMMGSVAAPSQLDAYAVREEYAEHLARVSKGPVIEPYEVNEFSGGGEIPLVPDERPPTWTRRGIEAARAERFARETESYYGQEAEPGRYVPGLRDIDEAAAAETEEAGEEVATGRSGGGMGRYFRVYMAAHLAMRGVEAAYRSYSFNQSFDPDQQGTDPDENTKQAIRELQKTRSGLTGFGRSVFMDAAPRDGSFKDYMRGPLTMALGLFGYHRSDFDDEAVQHQLEKNLKDDKEIQRQGVLKEQAEQVSEGVGRRLADARETLDIARRPEGVDRQFAVIHKRTEDMAQGFDEEAKLLEKAAQKITDGKERQDLLNRAAADRAEGRSIADQVETLERQDAARRDRVEKANRSGLTLAGIASAGARNDALELRMRGDTLGASEKEIGGNRELERQQAIARYRSSEGKITEPELEAELLGIDRRAGLLTQQARRQEVLHTSRLQDSVRELDLQGYARQQQQLADETATAEFSDPAHRDYYARQGRARLADLSRRHDMGVREMNDRTDEQRLRNDRQGRLADAIGLNHRMEEELARYEGDPQMQAAVRSKYKAQAEGMLQDLTTPHYSMSSDRAIYNGMLTAALGYDPKHPEAGNDAQRAKNAINTMIHNIDAQQAAAGAGASGKGAPGKDGPPMDTDTFNEAVQLLFQAMQNAMQLAVASGN